MDTEGTTSDDETTDEDTHGHAIRSGRIESAEEGDVIDDDTEGHAIRSGRGIKRGGLESATEDLDDSTEGHRYVPKDERFGGSEPKAMRGKLEQPDDTEGHGFRGNVAAAGEDDAEGHAMRGK